MKRWFFITVILLVGFFAEVYGQDRELTLDECVQIALKHNADIIMGKYIVDKAGKDVVVARANFLPQVTAGTGYYHSVLGPSSVLRIDPGTGIPVQPEEEEIVSWSSSAQLSVGQTVFRGGYNFFNYSMSRNLKKSAGYGFEDTRQSTIYVVKERYYNMLKAEKLLEVQEETLHSSEESYKRAQVLFEVGKVPKSDVLKAKVQLESDRLTMIETQNSLSIAQASLNHILGYDVDHHINIIDNLDLPESEVSYEDAMANALANHPAMKKGQFDVRAAKAGIGMAVSEFLPTLSAFYQYSWRHKDFERIKDMFDNDYNYYLGISLSIPVFQGFSRLANTSKAKLDHRSSVEALTQIKRNIALEAKQAYFEVQQAKKKIAVTNDAVEAAEEDLRLNKEKYNLGASTMLDLINSQVSATTARSNQIQALYDYKYAIAWLQKAMGSLVK